jgi:hypothetical protein
LQISYHKHLPYLILLSVAALAFGGCACEDTYWAWEQDVVPAAYAEDADNPFKCDRRAVPELSETEFAKQADPRLLAAALGDAEAACLPEKQVNNLK